MDELTTLVSLPEADKVTEGLVFTPREISQQPETWRETFKLLKEGSREARDFLVASGVDNRENNHAAIYLIGAGTSDYVGRALSSLMRLRLRCEVEAVPSTDLLTNMEDYVLHERRYLWVSFSRSGDSSEGVAVIEAALERYPNIYHLIVTCNRDGRMAREFTGLANTHCIVLGDRVNDRGLAMTSSFTNMVIAGQSLAHLQDLPSYESVLEDLIKASERFLSTAADVAAELAAEQCPKVCFLGTGSLKAVAIESALKVTELTAGRTLTWSESYLGVRHGPLSAVDADTLVVGFLSGDKRRQSYELDLLREVQRKQLSGKLVAVGPVNDLKDCPVDLFVPVPFTEQVHDFYRPPADAIFGQLFGLFSSIKAGLKPDTPSPKGAISRVVTQVKVY